MTTLDPTEESKRLIAQIAADKETIDTIRTRWTDWNTAPLRLATLDAGAYHPEIMSYFRRASADTAGIAGAARELITQLDDLRYHLSLIEGLIDEARRA